MSDPPGRFIHTYYREDTPMNATDSTIDFVTARTIDTLWDSARLVAWDGCHKLYIAMDDTQAAWFRAEYPHVVEDDDVEALIGTLAEWWDASCGFRFIQAVAHNAENPNAGFTSLIGQFEDDAA